MFKLDFFKTDTDAKIMKLETELHSFESAIIDAKEQRTVKEQELNDAVKQSIMETTTSSDNKTINKLHLELMHLNTKITTLENMILSNLAKLETLEAKKMQEREIDINRTISNLEQMKIDWKQEIIEALIPILAKWQALTGLQGHTFEFNHIVNDWQTKAAINQQISTVADEILEENQLKYPINRVIAEMKLNRETLQNKKYRRVA